MKKNAMNGSGEYQYGKLKAKCYKSAFLGYKCKAPKGGIFLSEDDLLRMSEINPVFKETNPQALREAYFSGKAVMDMFLSLPSGAEIIVYWQYYPANLHGGMEVAKLVAERQININKEKGWFPEERVHSVEIMGREFVGITSQYNMGAENDSYIREYFYECINGMITVVVKTGQYNVSDGDVLLRCLKKTF